jgi:hypothetical protein
MVKIGNLKRCVTLTNISESITDDASSYKGFVRKKGIILKLNPFECGVEAYLEDGEIRTRRIKCERYGNLNEDLLLNMKRKYTVQYILFFIMYCITLLVIGTACQERFNINIIQLLEPLICMSVITAGDIGIAKYLFSMLMSFLNKDIRNSKGISAAKYQVLNAYEYLGRIPTREEARKFSRFSTRSEYFETYEVENMLFTLSLIWAGICVHDAFPNQDLNLILEFFLVSAEIAILIIIDDKTAIDVEEILKHVFKYSSWFFLRRPTDEEIDLVLAGLKELTELNTDILNNKDVEFEEK